MDADLAPAAIRVLVFGAALRTGSTNARLASLAAGLVADSGAEVDLARMRDFAMPLYDGDVEDAEGLPPGALALSERIGQCHAFVISSPEYNASVPGPLKNAIDWVSRVRPQPFKTKHALLLSSSPSMIGGNRGLWALRVPLEHLGTRVYPDMFSLPRAHEGFTDDGRLAHPGAQERLAETVSGFMRLVCADVRFVCLHRRWYEFPGDRTDAPVTQRVED
ncbi:MULTISPECIES: NADPH-dependent FMN reductase [Streptomyces]|uniref:NAD(P)H-dependent oxidoreductase n=2 Tax=Streptomyces rimosus subsp. rimosus TaxID=132474 RepID=L8ESR4_STRR1|nr:MULTISPECIES: NAD(P)H-dependent oxidoreductase [Streptomyces]KOG80045.1 NADPH-dependent FMN reductase [Kitasatospora aureofaciens]MYT44208.1 NADPH-dependent oxidoreductase [Streptomyces sp. SID5471]KEF08314.1 NADPH-dependent FMN reductase [Streptomyces rimosus]KOT32091.1 NADPH-dependent FMN reductase [Streptomyces sp. NRRL WC-3701]KOT33080.1 NADPH-dependent FMN reductase [Streptomyces rimosus subsp. rimosus]